MKIGVPTEVKDHEYRVGATPAMVKAFAKGGHKIFIQKGAGSKIGFEDEDYRKAGATIVPGPKEVYAAEMVIKVKEPQPFEYPLLRENQILFCYLHLAPDPEQAAALLKRKVVGIAFETVVDHKRRLPLLTPMSEMAGRIAIQAGAYALHMSNGGRGVLLGGVPGVSPGKVVIIGGGIVGTQASKMAVGLGADVTILDNNLNRLRELDDLFDGKLKTLYSTPATVEEEVIAADLVIGAVLIPGKITPKLVTKGLIKKMKHGAVVVDVAIDQGGCCETSRPTTHSDPIYVQDEVVHYCVANMPGACARTATIALTNSVLPYALRLAELGYKKALLSDFLFLPGMNVCLGKVTNEHVAHDLNLDFHEPEEVLNAL
ncbi:alanine dehydrogenase [Candidatus Neptunichlamydia sp. REUL1]|uniref:alanine dehydrogenase n=1 Tax=Candidatus Neptunichlamydia sp. REUL1 TaxID=3064277 RepID=UPI002930F536|nr:alanine dehydrogenase [Candidatus Neptunochlamydia sp. REUL1]